VIGVTSDQFVKKLHKPHRIDSFQKRKEEVIKFLKSEYPFHRSEIIELNDRFGITVEDPDLQALVVSKRSEPMAASINSVRWSKGLPPIEIFSIDMVLAKDFRPISTTRIRRGVIDREGRLLR